MTTDVGNKEMWHLIADSTKTTHFCSVSAMFDIMSNMLSVRSKLSVLLSSKSQQVSEVEFPLLLMDGDTFWWVSFTDTLKL